MDRAKKKIRRVLLYGLIIAVCLLTNLPMLSMLGTAFKPTDEVMANTNLFTTNPSLDNFRKVAEKTSFPHAVVNTCIVALVVAGFCVTFASMAGVALSRSRGKLFGGFTMLLLVLQMIPGILIMIPLFSTLRALKLVDTHFSLIFIYISTNLPFGILTMKGFFDSIPTELDEAAMIDGASPYQTYWKIVFPTAIPGMISVAVYTLMSVWNEFTIANIFIQSTELQTLSVSLRQFQLQTTTDWGALSAAAAMACIPAFLFLIVVQKYLISGMTSGAVKG